MKKTAYFFAFVLLSFLYSCGGITDPVPTQTAFTVTVPSTAPSTAKVGDALAFAVNVAAPNTLTKFEVRKGSSSIGNVPTFTGATLTYNFNYTVTAQDAGQTLNFIFLAEDAKGNSKSATYTVNVTSNVSLITNTDVRLLNQGATVTVGTATGSFYISAENRVQNTAEADPAKVDITFGIVTLQPSFVSPDARVANNLNVGGKTGWTRTLFSTSTLNFDNVTATELNNVNPPTIQNLVVQNVVVGGVYFFQTTGNKRGLIRVKSLPPNGTGTDVVFDIKVIK